MEKYQFNAALKDISENMNHGLITPSQAINVLLGLQHNFDASSDKFNRIQDQFIFEDAPVSGDLIGKDEDSYYILTKDDEYILIDGAEVDGILDAVKYH